MTKKIIAVLLLLVGAFGVLAPHSVHLSLGLNAPHVYHVSIGAVLLIIGGFMLMKKKN